MNVRDFSWSSWSSCSIAAFAAVKLWMATRARTRTRTRTRFISWVVATDLNNCAVEVLLSGLVAKHLWVLLNPRYLGTAM